jgi:hypothetical protein
MGRQPHNALQQAVWRLSGCGLNRSMQHLISNYREEVAERPASTRPREVTRIPGIIEASEICGSRGFATEAKRSRHFRQRQLCCKPLKIAGLCADKLITGDS